MVQAIEKHGVPCQVGFQRRYDPAYQRARALIEQGALGRLEGIRLVGRDPHPPSLEFLKSSGGLLVDMGIHDLDSARFLLGEVLEVSAIGGTLAEPGLREYGLFDTAVATLRFENGAVGTLEVALRTAYGYDIRCEVLGEKGRIHIEYDRKPQLTLYDAQGGHFERPRNFEQRFAEAYRAGFGGLRPESTDRPAPAARCPRGLVLAAPGPGRPASPGDGAYGTGGRPWFFGVKNAEPCP